MDEIIKYRALKLRRNLSYAESVLWKLLRNRKLSGYKFRRQYVIEPYIVDFICLRKKLIIELDGYSHEFQASYDQQRTDYLCAQGYRVMRIQNIELLNRDQEVLERILESLK